MTRTHKRSISIMAVTAALSCAMALAGSPTITTRFFNSIDIGGFEACSWAEGKPAPNLEMETVVRSQVEESLEAKGYEIAFETADCTVATQAIRKGDFPIGMLVIEVSEKSTGRLAWRGEAAGLVNYEAKQLKKRVRKAVKEMFKDFPKAR